MICTWKTLRTISNNGWAKQSILAPLIGYLIIYNSQILIILGVDATPDASKFITWTRLHLTFFGLSFFGFASAIFQMYCPEVIKRFDNIEAYLEVELPTHTINSLIKLYENGFSIFGNEFKSQLTGAIAKTDAEQSNPVSAANLANTLILNESRINLMRIYYDFANQSKKYIAFFVGIIYLTASVMLATPFILLFIDVVKTTFHF